MPPGILEPLADRIPTSAYLACHHSTGNISDWGVSDLWDTEDWFAPKLVVLIQQVLTNQHQPPFVLLRSQVWHPLGKRLELVGLSLELFSIPSHTKVRSALMWPTAIAFSAWMHLTRLGIARFNHGIIMDRSARCKGMSRIRLTKLRRARCAK